MGRRVVTLTAERLGELPDPCRACAFWESAPGRAPADPAAHKAEWVAETTAAWGPCGLLVRVDDVPAGFVLYAPPGLVPRSPAFATSPISGDAILMTVLCVLPEHAGQGLGRVLVQSAAKDLIKRGERALEAYAGRGDGSPDECVLPVGFLEATGFVAVREHPVHPRMRLDLRTTAPWRDPVGVALGRLRGAVRAFPAGATRG